MHELEIYFCEQLNNREANFARTRPASVLSHPFEEVGLRAAEEAAALSRFGLGISTFSNAINCLHEVIAK